MWLSKAQYCIKNDFSVNFIMLLVVEFDLSPILSSVIFTLTSSRSKGFYLKILSLISFVSGGTEFPLHDVLIKFASSLDSISLDANSILKTISSSSLDSMFFSSLNFSFLRVSWSGKLYFLSPFHLISSLPNFFYM